MSAPHQLISPLIDHLHSDGRLRVWSVVITIFGDAVQPHGGTVAMADLQTILGHMGVENGALRTAMSRLAKEGWVTRDRQGRNSFYRLSPAGLKSFIPATEKIYRAQYAPTPQKLIFAVGPDVIGTAREQLNALLAGFGGMALRNGVALFADPSKHLLNQLQQADLLLIDADLEELPSWVAEKLELTEIEADYHALLNRYTPLGEQAEQLATLSPIDALCARILLIHEWRRLILKQPPLPAHLLPEDWPGAAAHHLVSGLYRQLIEPSENWWSNGNGAEARKVLAERF